MLGGALVLSEGLEGGVAVFLEREPAGGCEGRCHFGVEARTD